MRLGVEVGGARARTIDAICLTALARTGMAGHAGRSMQTLSGGEAQRVHIARTLAQADAARREHRPENRYRSLESQMRRFYSSERLGGSEGTYVAPGDGAFYLLFDEPTAGLNLEHQLLTLDIAREFASSGGGVLAVLHDLNLSAMTADRLVAMKGGRILAEGTPAKVLTDSLVSQLYNVHLGVGQVPWPPTPFILPQAAERGPRSV